MKKLLAVLLAFVLLCPGSLFAFSGAHAESGTADELPANAFVLNRLADGTAEIKRFILKEADEVTIPSEIDGMTVSAIGESAFYECDSLVSVTMPDTVTSLGDYAFYRCENLESVTFSNSLESIGYGAFSNCISLKEVRLPSSLKTLGEFVFIFCSRLESINLPDSLTSIGHGTFNHCNSLTEVIVSPDHPAYGYGNSALIDKRDRTFVQYVGPDTESYELPRGIDTIGADAFSFHGIRSVVIPQGVKTIGDRAFSLMVVLGEVIIPDSVTSIGYKAFYSCGNLDSIRIPASVTEIEGGNFSWCHMKQIEVDPANPVFEMQGSMLVNKAEHKLVFHLDLDSGTFEVPEGIEIIGLGAFENSEQLETLILPDSVKEIGMDAFAVCNNLTSLRLPKNLKTVERGMVRDCKSIRSITLPEGVETIKSLAISYNENLEEIIIPASVTDIGINAFANCPKLTCKVTEGSAAQKFCEKNGIRYEIQK